MDEAPTRKHVEAHAKAVVEGDMDSVVNDLVPDLLPSDAASFMRTHEP